MRGLILRFLFGDTPAAGFANVYPCGAVSRYTLRNRGFQAHEEDEAQRLDTPLLRPQLTC